MNVLEIRRALGSSFRKASRISSEQLRWVSWTSLEPKEIWARDMIPLEQKAASEMSRMAFSAQGYAKASNYEDEPLKGNPF
ncbi:hypothetical protein VTL71DRAFT_11721, partial [Oculimacula yallundae]